MAERLKADVGRDPITVRVADPPTAGRVPGIASRIAAVHGETVEGGTVQLRVGGGDAVIAPLVFSLIQPLFFLALFGPLLARSIEVPGCGSVWQWFVPGIIVMSALFGTSMTGSNLLYEMQTGSHERMLVTPLSRTSLLVGRALKEIAPLTSRRSSSSQS